MSLEWGICYFFLLFNCSYDNNRHHSVFNCISDHCLSICSCLWKSRFKGYEYFKAVCHEGSHFLRRPCQFQPPTKAFGNIFLIIIFQNFISFAIFMILTFYCADLVFIFLLLATLFTSRACLNSFFLKQLSMSGK